MSRLWNCHASTITGFLAALDESYGGAVPYLASCGLPEKDSAILKNKLKSLVEHDLKDIA
ncbi:hypothetical protein AIOL_003400 [Candidatus Rhodobacter oscarellae]|uniref:Uncharacterized protein n=1 Tax=Candidatus Rhodobacter oscarellae TaxID=1675527 RepID=A0A0J9E6V8_9RHOB|nr:hypothetical protein AIOL_003400 [Candidatus Rhodobacter lobularis]